MPFSGSNLQLPDSAEKLAFRAVENVLRDDSTLGSLVRTWATWSGEDTDIIEPTASTVPFLGIAPVASASDWVTEGQHSQPMSVAIMVAIEGTDVGQLMDLWACIRRAIFPADRTAAEAIRTAFQTAGISKPTFTSPAFALEIDKASGTRIAYAAGSIRLTMLVKT